MDIFDYELYIFDFDGTLIDTEPYHLKAWNLVIIDFLKGDTDSELSLSDYQKYFHSLQPDSVKNFLNIKYDLDYNKFDYIYKLKQTYYETLIKLEDVPFIKGANEFLTKILELRKKFIIVTNTSQQFINFFKDKYPILGKADAIFTKENFIHRKPHPECYLKIEQLYPEIKKIGFEDSLTGMNALYKVKNIKPVLIYDNQYYHNDYMINNFKNISILNEYDISNFKLNLEKDIYPKDTFIENILKNNIQELHNNFVVMKTIIRDIVLILRNMNKNNNIYLSGMGKSGYICKKSASTWQSLSIPCSYIDLPNLPHGDFGIFRNGDILILISNGGNTEEIIYILKYIKNNLGKKITTISIVANKDSKMAKLSDYSFVLKNIREADNINMTPSTSSIIFMGLLDAIGIALQDNITKDEFKLVHPAGSLGKK